MIYVLVRFGQACKDFLLPQQIMWHGTLTLTQTETGLKEDVSIPLRCMDGLWLVDLPRHYQWQDDPACAGERKVAEDSRFYLQGTDSVISLFFTKLEAADLSMRKFLLSAGSPVTIGRGAENTIQYSSPLISNQHSQLVFDGFRCQYRDCSRNASFLNREMVHQSTSTLSIGDEIFIAPALKIVCLGNRIAINSPPGLVRIGLSAWSQPEIGEARKPPQNMLATVEYHRAPRLLERPDDEPVDIEPPIAKTDNNSMPLLLTIGPSMTMMLPMLMGSIMASGGGSGYMSAGLAMIGTSSVLAVGWGLANNRYRKKQAATTENKRQRLYRSYIIETEKKLTALYQREQQRLLRNYPSSEECTRLGDGRNVRLWERMPTHTDFMAVRFGLGNVRLPNPLNVGKKQLSLIDDPMRDEPERLRTLYGTVRDVPIAISLRTEPIVGVFGSNAVQSIITSMIVQLAAMQSYHDVKIVILCDESSESQWMWARWLPHVYPTEDRNLRLVVSRPSARREVLSYLEEVIQMRKESENDSNQDESEKLDDPNQRYDTLQLPLPHYVIFSLSPDLLENEPVMSHLLAHTPGFTLVCAAHQLERLPKECRVIVSAEKSYMGVFTTAGDITQVHFDATPINASMKFARDLARVRVHDTATGAAIPSIVSFLEIYHTHDVAELDVWRFWNENHAYEGLGSIIGLRAGGKPFTLDISDKKHGPHGLVAGTTGSGKSVMLQTYILSLALNYHPSQVQFILIDYKGGGMADAFIKLPHVAGTIDNLQGIRAIQRALASIRGEITRREAIFKNAGVFSIDEYMRAFHEQPDHETLSHLIIVVDEFAELKKEQPDFMRELISASRVGRSVGVHLILATQKPSNSVDDEIWSNARFRICLRVQGRADSMDMLKRPDAAYIKGMGRCYVQIGNDEIFEEVQTSWSGAAYNPNDNATLEKPHLLNDAGQPIRYASRQKKSKDEATQMAAVMDRIYSVAKEHNVVAAKRLWLDILPSVIRLDDIPGYARRTWKTGQPDGLSAIVGLADDLPNQRRVPVEIDFAQNRSYLFVGLSSSGKTTLLQTLTTSLCARYTPDQLHIYAFSLSSRTLGTLREFPHVGDIVFDDDPYEILRLLHYLIGENERRRKLFTLAATDSYIAYCRSVAVTPELTPIPAIVVLLDRIAQLEEVLGEEQQNEFHQLIREGSSRGIFFAATAMGLDEVFHKVRDCFRTVALQLHQRSDYLDVLGVRIPPEMSDIQQNTGRGIVVIDGAPYEWQAALFGRRETDAERAKEIFSYAKEMDSIWTGERAPSIPRVPEIPTWDTLAQDAQKYDACDLLTLPVGYLSMEGTPWAVDLYKQFTWLVLGGRGCGRTTYLEGIARSFSKQDGEITIFGGSEWGGVASELGARYYTPDEYQKCDFNDIMLKEIRNRNEMHRNVDIKDEKAGRAFAKQFKPFVVILDDMDAIVSSINNELLLMLQNACYKAGGLGFYLFASVSMGKVAQVKPDRLFRAMVEMQTAILLSTKLSDVEFLDYGNLGYSAKKISPPMGEGYVVERGVVRRITTPKQ